MSTVEYVSFLFVVIVPGDRIEDIADRHPRYAQVLGGRLRFGRCVVAQGVGPTRA